MKGTLVENVDSSWIEALAGLSRWYILRTPPRLASPACAETAAAMPAASRPAAANALSARPIGVPPCRSRPLDPAVEAGRGLLHRAPQGWRPTRRGGRLAQASRPQRPLGVERVTGRAQRAAPPQPGVMPL